MIPDPWSCFDRIYCINLKERPDRRSHAECQFAKVGLAGRVTYMTAARHPQDCEQGIYESHLACIRQGLAAGARRMLVFEDDVLFDNYQPSKLCAALEFLEEQPDWRIFFLGCLVKKSRATRSSAVRTVTYRCLAHAYALNRPAAEAIVRQPWCGLPFDAMLARSMPTAYACYPAVAFQSDAASDNYRHKKLDAFRRWCGGLKRIQKFNEWYHRHAAVLAAAHLIGLGVLLWMIVR